MIKIYNSENIPQFKPGRKIPNQINVMCRKYKAKPVVKVFRRPAKNFQYRGVTIENHITLYWSNLETTESILWVFAHELRHLLINRTRWLTEALAIKELQLLESITRKKLENMSVSKANSSIYNNIGVTEIICDIFATEEIGKDYGDLWYMKRLNLKGEKKWRQK